MMCWGKCPRSRTPSFTAPQIGTSCSAFTTRSIAWRKPKSSCVVLLHIAPCSSGRYWPPLACSPSNSSSPTPACGGCRERDPKAEIRNPKEIRRPNYEITTNHKELADVKLPYPMTFANPHFADPQWLWLAVLGPLVLIALQRYSAWMRNKQLAQIAAPEFLADLRSEER